MARLIYDSPMEQSIDEAAREAIKAGCESFVHNDKICEVHVTWTQVASVEKLPAL